MSIAVAPEPEVLPELAPAPRPRLYRAIWRWHFYAGLIVAPVLFITALTGGLYVFKNEIETAVHRDILLVAPGETRIGPDAVLAAVARHKPDMTPVRLLISTDRTRAVVVHVEPKQARGEAAARGEGVGQPTAVAVNPYTGMVTGEMPTRSGFFKVVLEVHRRLYAGTVGRIVVELSTSWALVLLVTGVYLWWPKRGQSAGGVWVPRLRGNAYVVLRDWHAVPAFYLSALAGLILLTGLVFTLGWGTGFKWTQDLTGASTKDFFFAPPSGSTPGSFQPAAVKTAVRLAQEQWPESAVNVTLPRKPADSIGVIARNRTGPVAAGTLAVDPASGALLKQNDYEALPPLAKARMWALPIHMGSVFGTPTKILAVLVCLLLMGLAVTGTWMWWQRRPTGAAGLPPRAEVHMPSWLLALILLLGMFLPALGASLVLILIGDWTWDWLRGLRTSS